MSRVQPKGESMSSINDATPEEWDRAQKTGLEPWSIPAIEESRKLHPTTRALPTDPIARKMIPVYTGFISYFPRAIAAISKVSLVGGIQHGQTAETLNWDRSKSGDELDALMRHLLDQDWAQVAWRAMANLEKELEKEHG